MDDDLSDVLEWSEDIYTSEDLAEHFKFPQLVKICEGHYGVVDCESFSHGDILKVHGIREIEIIEAVAISPGNNHSTAVNVPLAYEGSLKVLSMREDGYVYKLVSDLAEDFPKAVVATKAFCAVGGQLVTNGDILELVSIDRRCTHAGVKEYLICKHQERDVALSMDTTGNFVVYPDEKEYTIPEFIAKYRLPQRVIFTDTTLQQCCADNLLAYLSYQKEFYGEFIFSKISQRRVLIASTRMECMPCAEKSISVDSTYRSCIVIIPLTSEGGMKLDFQIAVNNRDKIQYMLDQFHFIDMDSISEIPYIEYANRVSIYSTNDYLSDGYLQPRPALLPRKPNTDGSSDSDEYDYVQPYPDVLNNLTGSNGASAPVQAGYLPMTLASRKSNSNEENVKAVTQNAVNNAKHKKKFKEKLSQSIDNLAERFSRKSRISEQPKPVISAPIPMKMEKCVLNRASDDYENVYHSLQNIRPLGARPKKGSPKIGIARPQGYATMMGTEENTEFDSDVNSNTDSPVLPQRSNIQTKRASIPNEYSEFRVKIPPERKIPPPVLKIPPPVLKIPSAVLPKPCASKSQYSTNNINSHHEQIECTEQANRQSEKSLSSEKGDQSLAKGPGYRSRLRSLNNDKESVEIVKNEPNSPAIVHIVSYDLHVTDQKSSTVSTQENNSSQRLITHQHVSPLFVSLPPDNTKDNLSEHEQSQTEKIQEHSNPNTNLHKNNDSDRFQYINRIHAIEDIPADLSSLSVKEISSVLNLCGLENIAELFKKELIDGDLFMHLTEEILGDDFGLSKFEQLKVAKIQNGYRPKL